jgi:hypothetical protein
MYLEKYKTAVVDLLQQDCHFTKHQREIAAAIKVMVYNWQRSACCATCFR